MSTSPGPESFSRRTLPGARRRARERALELLYEAETKDLSPSELLAELPVAPEGYASQLVRGVERRAEEVNDLLRRHASGWTVERMPAIDRCVLRIATYELLGEPEVPVAVVLDEAVDLAKAYSTEDSGRYVNGVLSGVAREARPGHEGPPMTAGAHESAGAGEQDSAGAYESAGPHDSACAAGEQDSAGAYESAGVDYDVLDAAKRRSLAAAATTLGLPADRGAVLCAASLGEPATVFEVGGVTLAFVLECLGTKSMIARAYEEATGIDRFDAIGRDAVAAIVNDLCCVGALPLVINAYVATGSASWYAGTRHASLVAGWLRACEDAGSAWGGGESPTLTGLIDADQVDLAGSAVGRVPAGGSAWLGAELAPGDDIVLVAATGLHANGASLARQLASELPGGWRTKLANGRPYGEAVLDPGALYAGLIERLWAGGVPVRYASHITGHGLRKVMRADRELTYRIDRLPAVPDVLAFLVSEAGLDARQAYATFNMGAGFAVFTAAGAGQGAVAAARAAGHEAILAGKVEEGPRQVVLEPVGVSYLSRDLDVR